MSKFPDYKFVWQLCDMMNIPMRAGCKFYIRREIAKNTEDAIDETTTESILNTVERKLVERASALTS